MKNLKNIKHLRKLKQFKDYLKKYKKILQKLFEKLIKFCCTTMLNYRTKIIVYISCIKFFGSCMYRYTEYTIHDTRRFRLSCSELCYTYSVHRCTLYSNDELNGTQKQIKAGCKIEDIPGHSPHLELNAS